jgi:hypothetical protein
MDIFQRHGALCRKANVCHHIVCLDGIHAHELSDRRLGCRVGLVKCAETLALVDSEAPTMRVNVCVSTSPAKAAKRK